MAKIEHIFRMLLEKKDYSKNDLIDVTKQISDVSEDKIETRLNKLIISGNLFSYNRNMISLNSPSKLTNLNFDEIHVYGPITIGIKGRQTFVISNFETEKHQKMIGDIKFDLPQLKQEVDNLLIEIKNLIVQNFNPLDALGYISFTNLACESEECSESNFEEKQFFVELVHNIILKHDFSVFPKNSDDTKFDELEKLLNEYWSKFNWLIICETISKDELSYEEQDIYIRTILNFLFVRSEAYPQHYQQTAEELFSNIQHILSGKGFTIEDYFSTLNEINRQINSRISRQLNFLYNIKEERDSFIDFIEKNEKEKKSPKETSDEYEEKILEIKAKFYPDYEIFQEADFPRCLYEIKLNEKVNTILLDLLVLNFGSNKDWSSPFDISDIPLRPLIKVEGKFYCFIKQNLIKNVIPIIESLLLSSEFNEYRDEKGNYFESKTLKLFCNILPNAEIYSKLKYPNNNELDGLVIHKDNLFLIEVKGKKRRCIACADDILDMTKEDVQASVNSAFEQSKRALEYIKNDEEVNFVSDENGANITIHKKSIKSVFLINVTASSFSEFTTDLRVLKLWDQNLIKGDIYPWNVNIYDLLVIVDLLENEDDFIEYVSERIRLGKDNDIVAWDELDYLGYYLEHGSLTKTEDVDSGITPTTIRYTKNIDKWYSYQRGEIPFAEKPRKKS